MMFPWINIELSSKCNKSCYFCGRAEARKNDELEQGDMSLDLLNDILVQFDGDIVQFNRDGEPLLYEHIWTVGQICRPFVSNIVTNGKLLWDKRDALVDNFTSVTVSVFEDDEEQFENVKHFIEYKKESPMILIKFLGDYYNNEYKRLGMRTLMRSIHAPEGDVDYVQSSPPIPEIGVCVDFLCKPAIDWKGNMHICNRYDPDNKGVIGNCNEQSLRDIWESDLRKRMMDLHLTGLRNEMSLCSTCNYWGFPSNG